MNRRRAHTIVLAGALACTLVLGTLLLYVYYDPYRRDVTGDDAYVVVQSAYFSVVRDGLMYWGSDRIGGLHVIVANVLLERMGLSKWVSHCSYLQVQNIVCMLVGLCVAVRRWRACLLGVPAVVAVLTSTDVTDANPMRGYWAYLSTWVCRIGVAYPAVMLAVLTLFAAVEHLQAARDKWWKHVLVLALLFALSQLASPGNVVLTGVWCLLCAAYEVCARRAGWLKWITCAGVLLVVWRLMPLVLLLRDAHVHQWGMPTSKGFAWHMWPATMLRFWHQIKGDEPVMQITMYAGAGLCVLGWVAIAVRRAGRVGRWLTHMMPAACGWRLCLLTSAGVVYLVVIAAHSWVHRNPANPSYIVPVWYLFAAACLCAIDVVASKLRWSWVVILVVVMNGLAVANVCRHRPRMRSHWARQADAFLEYATQHGGYMPLIGEFWSTSVQSVFDPKRLPSSTVDRNLYTAVMLPIVLQHPRVWIKFAGIATGDFAPQHPYVVLNDKVLVPGHGAMPPPLADWRMYDVMDGHHIEILATNLLEGRQQVLGGSTVLSNGVLFMRGPEKRLSEAYWMLGRIPAGVYRLSVTARYTGRGRPSNVLVLHLIDDAHHTWLTVDPVAASSEPREYSRLVYYPGSSAPALARLFCLADEPYAVYGARVQPVKVHKK